MIDWGCSARPQKAKVREFLLGSLGHRPNSVWLPSENGEDVRLALANGVLKQSDSPMLVEIDDEVFVKMNGFASQILPNAKLEHASLADTTPPTGCNYAYIDLMGALNMGLCRWIERLVANRADDLVVDIAVPLNWRNSGFMQTFTESIQQIAPRQYDQLSLDATIVAKWMVAPMAVLSCALSEYDILFERPIRYRDSVQSMLVFRFSDINEGPNLEYNWPSIEEVMMNSSEAANKAWATRRANEEAGAIAVAVGRAIRSARAHKAVATRRSNAAAIDRPVSKGSMAALKAWDTRRENGWVHPNKRAA